MKDLSILVFGFVLFTFFGCGSSPEPPVSQEARERQNFARGISEKYPYRVSFSAQGKEKEILDIAVIEEVAPYAVSGTVEMIVTDKLKQDAKALKFEQIIIKGGRKSFGDRDTIDKTILLR